VSLRTLKRVREWKNELPGICVPTPGRFRRRLYATRLLASSLKYAKWSALCTMHAIKYSRPHPYIDALQSLQLTLPFDSMVLKTQGMPRAQIFPCIRAAVNARHGHGLNASRKNKDTYVHTYMHMYVNLVQYGDHVKIVSALIGGANTFLVQSWPSWQLS